MDTLLTIAHVVVCLFLVGIVLLQHGKGADIGATFGGSSQSLFGTEGPLPLLNKITTAAAIIFMLTSVSLAYLSTQKSSSSVMKNVVIEQPAAQEEAAVPMAQEDAMQPVAEEAAPTATPATEGAQQQ
ncbi:preprotein translocase subunit SecG [Desulfopila sp. IMCC35008]|uniref:preprotein translocase subunit SecG n=1 Tax=Desulfopila sp. IMCC35008 TaxID=2653858 RepID=UPI0013D0D5A0|nr:preprotein translocase subunit SecG [Desulfopila sp. IMCC35008]